MDKSLWSGIVIDIGPLLLALNVIWAVTLSYIATQRERTKRWRQVYGTVDITHDR